MNKRKQIKDQLGIQLWTQLRRQLKNQLSDHLWYQLYDQLGGNIYDELRGQSGIGYFCDFMLGSKSISQIDLMNKLPTTGGKMKELTSKMLKEISNLKEERDRLKSESLFLFGQNKTLELECDSLRSLLEKSINQTDKATGLLKEMLNG